jgi:hypothetical protein
MKVYEKYKDALAKHGYTVDVDGCVWDERGNQAAMEDRFGNAFCNDPNVTDICRAAEVAKPKTKKKSKAPEGKKRARTAKGHYVKDDPNTPENEAWVDE